MADKHRLSPEDSVKGGQQKSDRKTFANRFKSVKYCTQLCPLYPCVYVGMCQPSASRAAKGRRACIVKTLDAETQERLWRLLNPTEDNYRVVLTNLLSELHKLVADRKTVHTISMMLDYTIKVNDTLWGKKMRQEVKGDLTGDVTIKWKD